MYSALNISRYLINSSIKRRHPISNLKLQKLLYYAQAYFLVELNQSLFDESIVNWKYGPVVIEAYDEFKSFGSLEINDPIVEITEMSFSNEPFEISITTKKFDENEIDPITRQNLDTIIDSYINYNAISIMRKTHKEDPWLATINGDKIDLMLIKNYFYHNRERILGE